MFRSSIFAALLSLACAAPVVAAPVSIDFSFDSVSGTFYGLDNSDGISQASSFDLMGDADNYLGVSAEPATKNDFTFDSGELSQVHFEITPVPGVPGESGTGTLNYFAIIFNTNGLFGDTRETPEAPSPNIEPRDLTFTVRPVPLPAGAILLLTGIAAVGGLRLRKKRAVQA